MRMVAWAGFFFVLHPPWLATRDGLVKVGYGGPAVRSFASTGLFFSPSEVGRLFQEVEAGRPITNHRTGTITTVGHAFYRQRFRGGGQVALTGLADLSAGGDADAVGVEEQAGPHGGIEGRGTTGLASVGGWIREGSSNGDYIEQGEDQVSSGGLASGA